MIEERSSREKADEILRRIAEEKIPLGNSSYNKQQSGNNNIKPRTCQMLSFSPIKWMNRKRRLFKPRKYLGAKILGSNSKNGNGILVEVDLKRMTKEQVEEFHTAIKHLRRAGITFDTWFGSMYGMEFDWSLKGMTAKCGRCGYNSERHGEQLDESDAKEKDPDNCNICNKLITKNSIDYYIIKKYFWSRKSYYHRDCLEYLKYQNSCNRCGKYHIFSYRNSTQYDKKKYVGYCHICKKLVEYVGRYYYTKQYFWSKARYCHEECWNKDDSDNNNNRWVRRIVIGKAL